jgi:hypothetical protein
VVVFVLNVHRRKPWPLTAFEYLTYRPVEAPVSYPYFERFREQRDVFAGAAAFQQSVPFNVAIEGAKDANKDRIFGHIVSPEYFPVLGTVAARGRLFSPEIDKPGSPGRSGR